jgi:hypothetical protein
MRKLFPLGLIALVASSCDEGDVCVRTADGNGPNGERSPPALAPSRAVALRCARERPCNTIWAPGNACELHRDCSDGVNGRCQAYGSACSYDACFTDDDCAPTELCDCAGGVDGSHRCLLAACRTNADCPDSLLCSPSAAVTCPHLSGVVGYFCHTPSDECTSDTECGAGRCVFDEGVSHWVCSMSLCAL